jgi:predicted dehydrogenase
MSKPIRIGVIGCGSVARGPYSRNIETLRHQGKAEVVVACDVHLDRAEALAKFHGISRTTTRYQDVLDASDVDLVLVTTSMNEHGPLAKAGLLAGKHVLVEKPMATSMEQAAELLELQRTSPGYLVCAPHVILSHTFQEIWRHVHGGTVGTVFNARARYGWHPGPTWGKWFFEPGGGALFDLGVYNVTALCALLGPCKRVTAMTGQAVPERVVEGELIKTVAEDNAHVLMDFGNSVFAVVTTGFTMPSYRSPCIELYGSKGTVQMLGDDWAPEGYELFTHEQDAWTVYGAGPDRWWPWTDGIRHLVDCINTKTKPIIQPEQAYHSLEIMLAAQAAGKDGQAREIKSTFTPITFWNDKVTAGGHSHDRTRIDD